MFGRFTTVARSLGRPIFFVQKMLLQKKKDHFFWKTILLVSLSRKNQTPCWTLIEEQFFQALGHERAQFTSVGCSQGSQLQQTFPELILEPREERNTFYRSNWKVQSPSLSPRIRPLIKPISKKSFPTNFQGTGPWEGPVHFSRFVLRVHNCDNFSRADPGDSWS